MSIVLTLHSLVRWIVVLIALAALIKFGLGYIRKEAPTSADRGLMSGLSGIIDLQALLGIILALSVGLSTNRIADFIPHILVMIVVVLTAHLPMRWRREQDTTVLRNNLFVIIAVLVLVLIGITLLPQTLV